MPRSTVVVVDAYHVKRRRYNARTFPATGAGGKGGLVKIMRSLTAGVLAAALFSYCSTSVFFSLRRQQWISSIKTSAAATGGSDTIKIKTENLAAASRTSADDESANRTKEPRNDTTLHISSSAAATKNSVDLLLPHDSQVTRLSLGMDLFENVCYRYRIKDDKHEFRSYKKNAKRKAKTNLEATLLEFFQAFNERRHMVFKTFPIEDWTLDSTDNEIVEEALYTQRLFENPAHCLNDYIFSVSLDRYLRSSSTKKTPNYSRFVVDSYERRARLKPNWCYRMLDVLHYIDIYNKSSLVTFRDGFQCFRKLYMPPISLYRNTLNNTALHAKYQAQVKSWDPDNDFFNVPAYPVQALLDSRRSLFGTSSLRLNGAAWEGKDTKAGEGEDLPILFYGREGVNHRIWQNPRALKRILERDYRVSIDLVGKEWNRFTFEQQLALYNNYSHIVAIHGAHLANLIAARPNTRFVEIYCLCNPDERANESLTSYAGSDPDWYGAMTWFSTFTRRIGIEHFVLSADEDCTGIEIDSCGKDSAFWTVNPERAVPFIVNRFKLQPR